MPSEHGGKIDNYQLKTYSRFIHRVILGKTSECCSAKLDGLVKFWSKVFESLFADSKYNITCKWGESQAHCNEYKIDVRVVVVKGSDEVNLVDVEAARYLSNKKTNNDHLQLAIESKGILDHIIKQVHSFDPHKTLVYRI